MNGPPLVSVSKRKLQHRCRVETAVRCGMGSLRTRDQDQDSVRAPGWSRGVWMGPAGVWIQELRGMGAVAAPLPPCVCEAFVGNGARVRARGDAVSDVLGRSRGLSAVPHCVRGEGLVRFPSASRWGSRVLHRRGGAVDPLPPACPASSGGPHQDRVSDSNRQPAPH